MTLVARSAMVVAGLVRRALAVRHPIAGALLPAVIAAVVGSVFTRLDGYPRPNAIAASFISLVGALVPPLRRARAAE